VEGLVWTKVWVGAFLGSYFVLAALSVLSPGDWRDNPTPLSSEEDKTMDTWSVLFAYGALIAHVYTCCWALFNIVYTDGISLFFDILNSQSDAGFVRLAGSLLWGSVYVFFYVLMGFVTFGGGLLLLYYITVILLLDSDGVRRVVNRLKPLLSPAWWEFAQYTLVLPIVFLVTWLFLAAFETEAVTSFCEIAVVITVQGGVLLLIFIGSLILLVKAMSFVFGLVAFIRHVKPKLNSHTFQILFGFSNFLLSFLYYQLVYDTEGTVKPSWTDNLG